MWNHIVLEKEQNDLFAEMVEAQRSLPREDRRKFALMKHMRGADLLHPGMSGGENVYEGDLEALVEAGLLRPSFGSKGTPLYDITPRGYQYYEKVKKSQDEPVERIEEHVRTLLESGRFQNEYLEAYAKWRDAEEMLWSSDSVEQLSKIGHSCREAMINFVNVLVDRFNPPEVDTDQAKTVNRLRSVLEYRANELGRTERRFLEALTEYWYKVSDLVQRQEHAALREGEELVWEDGRRVVFQTALVMYEVDRSLTS